MILLEDVDTAFGNIKILQDKNDGSITYFQNKCFHSQADEFGVSTCGYIHAMYEIILQSKAKHILMIGCAGGTLATMLSRAGCKVTVLDINDYAFTLAKRYFHMPKTVQCIVGDGAEYIRTAVQSFDAVAIDAFDSKGIVPKDLANADFFTHVKRILSPNGITVMNVMVAHDLDPLADSIALAMEEADLPSMLFDQPKQKSRNVIIAGGIGENIQIPSGNEPHAIQEELKKIICRRPLQRTALYSSNEGGK